jgi:hypothetical protein
LGIIDETEHWPAFGKLREEGQAGRRDQEPLISRALDQAKGAPKSDGLRAWQALEQMQCRPDELVQSGEWKLRLGLHPPRTKDVHVDGSLASVLQQSCFADPRLAAEDKRTASRGARRFEQRPDLGSLGVTSVEHALVVCPCGHQARAAKLI